MGWVSTPGLVLYLDLTAVDNCKEAFELMMGVADNITNDLGGTVLDENKQLLTREGARDLLIQIRKFDTSTKNLDLFSDTAMET